MNTEAPIELKTKQALEYLNILKWKDFWNSDKIKTIRPHELGTGFISKKTESQVYDADTASQGQLKFLEISTFVWTTHKYLIC
nr:hypothetical protein [Mycoplasmopsis bovis]